MIVMLIVVGVRSYVVKTTYTYHTTNTLKLFVKNVITETIFLDIKYMSDGDKVILHVNGDAKKHNTDNAVSQHSKYRLESCIGGSTDKRLYILVVQTIISISLVIFSLVMLSDKSLECNKDNLYSSILTLIVGYWIKSPLS